MCAGVGSRTVSCWLWSGSGGYRLAWPGRRCRLAHGWATDWRGQGAVSAPARSCCCCCGLLLAIRDGLQRSQSAGRCRLLRFHAAAAAAAREGRLRRGQGAGAGTGHVLPGMMHALLAGALPLEKSAAPGARATRPERYQGSDSACWRAAGSLQRWVGSVGSARYSAADTALLVRCIAGWLPAISCGLEGAVARSERRQGAEPPTAQRWCLRCGANPDTLRSASDRRLRGVMKGCPTSTEGE